MEPSHSPASEQDWTDGWQGPDDWGPTQYRLEHAAAAMLASSVRALARHRLTGRGRASAIVVLDALCDLVEEYLISRVFRSQRDLIEDAGIGSRTTVARALDHLQAEGFIKFAGTTGPGFGRCTLWDITRPIGDTPIAWSLPGKGLDIWRNPPTGIGHNAQLAYDAILDGHTAPLAIRNATGMASSSVYRALANLAARDLATRRPDGTWATGHTRPDEYGTTRTAALHRQHQRQRARYLPDSRR